jgi:hypothetical protein
MRCSQGEMQTISKPQWFVLRELPGNCPVNSLVLAQQPHILQDNNHADPPTLQRGKRSPQSKARPHTVRESFWTFAKKCSGHLVSKIGNSIYFDTSYTLDPPLDDARPQPI